MAVSTSVITGALNVHVEPLASSQCYVRDAHRGALSEACMLLHIVTSASAVCESHCSISYRSLFHRDKSLAHWFRLAG